MRIEFASGTRKPVAWSGASLRVGSAAGNDVRLQGEGVAAEHVCLAHDRRGLVLEVCKGAGLVYVNARRIRERALLRAGDSIGIGSEQLRVCADVLTAGAGDAATPTAPATMALRAVAGPLSGHVWALHGRLAVGADGRPTGALHDDVLVLRAEESSLRMDAAALAAAIAVRVNGVSARQADLVDGDQLAVGTHRFVVDISGSAGHARATAALPDADAARASLRTRAASHQMVWLIATAVLVAIIVAVVLLEHY